MVAYNRQLLVILRPQKGQMVTQITGVHEPVLKPREAEKPPKACQQ